MIHRHYINTCQNLIKSESYSHDNMFNSIINKLDQRLLPCLNTLGSFKAGSGRNYFGSWNKNILKLICVRKFSFHIFWRMGPDKQLPSSILVTKQQFPSRIQVVCWEAAILLLRSCKNDTGKVLQLYWDGAVKLPNSMMPNCCWDRAGLIFKQYFSSALKWSCIIYI